MTADHARRAFLAISTIAGVLAAGFAAMPASAAPERPPSTSPAMIQAMAHEQWLRAERLAASGPAGAALAQARMRSALLAAERRPAALTGVVRAIGGMPVAGACVTATGPDGSTVARSRADGWYVLAGLPAGRYTLRAGECARAAAGHGSAASTALWPGLPAQVTLASGQIETLPPVTLASAAGAAALLQPRAGTGAAGTGAAGTGGISGRVTGHGHPLSGICVDAIPVRSGIIPNAVTSTTGRYHITGIKPGRYNVQFAIEAFCGNHGNWLPQWYPGITTPFPSPRAAVISVKAGQTKTGINASLKLGGQIGGTVRSRSGKPLGGICVSVNGRIRGGFVGYGFPSGRAGHYVLHALFPGRYTVGFSTGCGNRGNYAPQWWRLKPSAALATPITISGAQIVSHVNAALDPGAAIAGTVRAVNSSGKPLTGVCVQATDNRGDDFADAVTAKDGSYRLKGLAGGRYLIVFDPSCQGNVSSNYLAQHRWVSVRRGRARANVDAFLQLGGGLSGVVTNAHGGPIAGVCVQISSGPGFGFAASADDGSYSITGLPAGKYTVQFAGGCGNSGSLAPQFFDNEPSESSADPIAVTAGTIKTGIDAAMQPGATITGTVTDPAGHRLNGVCVGIANQWQAIGGFGIFDDIQFTNNGRYRSQNLAPGLYQVDFGCGSGKYASHWYRARGDISTPSLLSLPGGVTSGINAAVRLGGAIAGTITNKAGKPLRLACVSVVDARTGAQVPESFNQGFATNGKYKINGLAAGTYKVQFYGCGSPHASQWYRGKSTEAAANPVRVKSGRMTSGIGAALGVGGSISGLVTAQATAKPVRGICVEAFDSATQSFGFDLTDTAGRYTMRGLSTGRYSVSFSPCLSRGTNLVALTRPALVHVRAPHAVTGINASLAAGGSISGTVQAGSRPQAGTCVEAVPVNPAGSFGFATTGRNGSYTAAGLAAGQYQVSFNDPFCGFSVPQFAAQWYNGQSTQATAASVTVSVGATTSGIDASLQPFGGISGTVTGPGNAPVAGECVKAVPAGKGFAGTVPPVFGITSAAGGYSLATVQPGTYKVKFSAGCGDSGFKTQWWKAASSKASATVITVASGAVVTGIDAALTR